MFLIQSIYLTAIRHVIKATRKGLKKTQKGNIMMQGNRTVVNKPTAAYIGATWGAMGIGIAAYLIGLWNATLMLNEKGFYFAVFLLAMFSAVTLQKTVRDRQEGIPVTNVFVGICWSAFFASIALLVLGLINADMALSEKGFYGISFVLSLFAIISVQKNVRDMTNDNGQTDPEVFPNVRKGAIDTAMDVSDIADF